MNALALLRKAVLCAIAAALCLAGARTLLAAQGQNQDEELEMGQEVFEELKGTGEIVESSPLYDQLRPIADGITYFVGIAIGVDLIFDGGALVAFGSAIHSLP
jgi:hypothetical protein